MAGKAGQHSKKATEIPARYAADFLSRLDRRCREARDQKTLFYGFAEECGGLKGLSLLELEAIRRFAHICRRIGRLEEVELTGGGIDQAAMNDATRSWLGLLRQVEVIKARHRDGRDLAKDFEYALRDGEDEIE